MVYDYLLVLFRLIVGFLTSKKLILFAIGGIVLYLIWICVAVALSFGRKYYKRCAKLTAFVKENEKSDENLSKICENAKSISSGLAIEIGSYKKTRVGYPSSYIKRSNSLDNEVTGGIFNHGKSLMRAYINLTTIFLFVLNLAFLGADKTLTVSIFAESFVLPIIYYILIRAFYFIYTSTQQQFYKMDVEKFNELVEALDEKYGEKVELNNITIESAPKQETEENRIKIDEEPAKETNIEVVNENVENQEQNLVEEIKLLEDEKIAEEPPKKTLDDYDFFKKKNIDVEKLVNEVPTNSSALPYIDVDSDYVIKDDENPTMGYDPNAKNGSEVLGGMMHDMSNAKREQPENNVQVENKQSNTESKEEKTSAQLEDVFKEFGNFEETDIKEEDNTTVLDEIKQETTTTTDTQDTPSLSHLESGSKNSSEEENTRIEQILKNLNEIENENSQSSSIEVQEEPQTKTETQNSSLVVENLNSEQVQTANEKPATSKNYLKNDERQAEKIKISQNNIDKKGDSIANLVDKFKSKNNTVTKSSYSPNAMTGFSSVKQNNLEKKNDEAQKPVSNKSILNNGDDQVGNFLKFDEGQNYSEVNSKFYGGFNGSKLKNEPAKETEQTKEKLTDKKIEETPKPVQNFTQTKLAEPKPAKEKVLDNKTTEQESKSKAKRGRPVKQVFDENVTIKNDEEFEAVLSRAEKLMRKSEEGLSASQSKRVEKELKTLLDAMNKYKENS